MAENPKNLRYTKDHEWAREDGDTIVVGITAHAQQLLGDVVYVELPKLGTIVTAGGQFGVVESTKAVSELYARERQSDEGQRGARSGARRNQF